MAKLMPNGDVWLDCAIAETDEQAKTEIKTAIKRMTTSGIMIHAVQQRLMWD
jgi:hypothetical protein